MPLLNHARYDGNGNLTSRTDTRSTTANYYYDALNRITSKSYSGGSAQSMPGVTYCYDGKVSVSGGTCGPYSPAITNSMGRLTSVSSSASATNYLSYDVFGRVTSSQQVTGGVTYGFTYGYNLAGTLTSIGYPNSGRTVTYDYDLAGRTTGVKYTTPTVPVPVSYATVSVFAPQGAIQSASYGSGETETTTFNSRLQPFTIQRSTTVSPVKSLLKLQYSYCSGGTDTSITVTCASNNGNVWGQAISFDALGSATSFSEAQTFTYDGVNRLASGQTSAWSQSNGFDLVGNRWVSGAAGLPAMSAETPQGGSWFGSTTNRIVQAGWSYDPMGNVFGISALGRTMLYDAENRMVQASVNGSVTNYTYDGDGRRVTKSSPATTYVYL